METFGGRKVVGKDGSQYYATRDDLTSCSGYAVDLKNKSRAEHDKPEHERKYDTLAWGYDGEGPELLAITMLASALYPQWESSWVAIGSYGSRHYSPWKHPARDLILKHYRAFTEEIVANLPDSWTMTSDDVLAWLEKKEKQ